MPKKQVLHEQYYLWGKAELLQKRGASKEEIKAVLNEAILLTKPFFGKKKNTSNNILNLVADYIFGYIKGMPSCNSNWEQVGNPYMILKADKLN